MKLPVTGFSKKNKDQKIDWILDTHFDSGTVKEILLSYHNSDPELEKRHSEFAENTISNFYLPFGVAPNFLINKKWYTLPMVIEESSVIAAASNAAKFWAQRGGFSAQVLATEKVGQVHFMFNGTFDRLHSFFEFSKAQLYTAIEPLTANMRKRGGGVTTIELRDKSEELSGYYQLHCTFETADAMGANFINSCLEKLGLTLIDLAKEYSDFTTVEKDIEVVMNILSNYVPNCRARAEVSCPISDLPTSQNLSPRAYAEKFVRAVRIAEIEPYRAVTHNKGIMNGIDALVIATGNDFRAVEAGVHAYASKNGRYTSLSKALIQDNNLVFSLEIPLALGTVGGLTKLHPLATFSLQLLGNPNAEELMEIVAVAGLAQNFAAVNSLITTGIQQGHMKMHLLNILNQLNATEQEKKHLIDYFRTHTVSYSEVTAQLSELRTYKR